MIEKLLKAIKNPYWAFGVVLRRFFSRWIDDRTFIRWEYFSGMGKFPNIEHPVTYNEKLQWLKLYDQHPEYTKMVDKYEAKIIIEYGFIGYHRPHFQPVSRFAF